MGFWKKIGESIKETGTNISNEIQRRQELTRIKHQILDRFEMSELKKICKDYGIGEPLPYEENLITSEKSKRTVTREHFINRIVDGLTLDQLKNFCDKNRIKIWDITKEEKPIPQSQSIPLNEQVQETQEPEQKVTSIEVKRQSEFDSILEEIEENFEPIDIRDEPEFEKQLTIFLKGKYPGRVNRQVETQKGKIDLVIDNKYAIELKIADGKGKLRDLVGQALSYKKIYNNIAVILLDVRKMSSSEIQEYIDEYEEHGIKTIIVLGTLRRRKGKSKQINIKL
jgi:hypothetical protein